MTILARIESDPILIAPLAIEVSILRTVLYADVFDHVLTQTEIHRYLESEPISPDELNAILGASDWLAARITRNGNMFALNGRIGLADIRRLREGHSAKLWIEARRWGRCLAHLPFVRMAAVTGALSMNNAAPRDDIDFLIVTVPGRVWLARAFAVGLVRIAQWFGVRLCPNYVLAENALTQTRRDLFVAHEIAQMVPLAGASIYKQMCAANAWVAGYLPNAGNAPRSEPDLAPQGLGRFVQRALEWALSGFLGDRLERWERNRKIAKFRTKLEQAAASAVLDESQVKGHFNDYGQKAIEAYEARCRAHQLTVAE